MGLSVCVCILLGVYSSPPAVRSRPNSAIHLEMVMGEIKITPCDLGGIWGVLGVRK